MQNIIDTCKQKKKKETMQLPSVDQLASVKNIVALVYSKTYAYVAIIRNRNIVTIKYFYIQYDKYTYICFVIFFIGW